MDLDAILRRRPKIALVDELAHTNLPGSGRNEKRWQDVLEILGAGINVITTVNIQHLESIADEVEHMTGAKVRERVPDWVVRKADQIALVDSSPEQLRRRMIHGNIYPKERAPQALAHFFRTDNLITLRELALRFLADQTDEELLAYLRQHNSQVLWETNERIMVAVTAEPGTDAARAIREAGAFGIDVHVIAAVPDRHKASVAKHQEPP
jgi:two-component system sensor histidine kinase KdpD